MCDYVYRYLPYLGYSRGEAGVVIVPFQAELLGGRHLANRNFSLLLFVIIDVQNWMLIIGHDL